MLPPIEHSKHRWFFNLLIIITCLSLGAASVGFYRARTDQNIFNHKIDHAADKITCSIEGIIKTSKHEINDPNSQTRRLYVSLGFRPEQIADIVDQANFSLDREIRLLPPHPPCDPKKAKAS